MALKLSTIRQTVTFNAPPEVVYEILTDSKKHAAFTGSAAKISGSVGGRLTAGDGYIKGRNLVLTKGKRIVQDWSTTEWPRGYPPSRLEIRLSKAKGGTRLLMVHSKVPAEQRDYYEQGWKDFYWAPLKKYLAAKS